MTSVHCVKELLFVFSSKASLTSCPFIRTTVTGNVSKLHSKSKFCCFNPNNKKKKKEYPNLKNSI